MKIRIKFRKFGCMKFVGHLDMMRFFQKAIRRAEIDIRYTGGYSPHQMMSFAAPLGVGITSDGEYFDIEVSTTQTSSQSIQALNAAMVEGVEIIGYVLLPDDSKPAMSLVAAADYILSFAKADLAVLSKEEWQERLQEEFHQKEQFLITKKTKKSERELDLKPLVHVLKMEDDRKDAAFRIFLSSGSTDNLKPELVLESIFQKCGIPFAGQALKIHRLDVYANSCNEEGLVPLLSFGKEIV